MLNRSYAAMTPVRYERGWTNLTGNFAQSQNIVYGEITEWSFSNHTPMIFQGLLLTDMFNFNPSMDK